MNILLVGSGAREHCLAWKIRQSPRLDDLFVAPGNPGTAAIAENLPVKASDLEGIARVAKEHRNGPLLLGGFIEQLVVRGEPEGGLEGLEVVVRLFKILQKS